MLPDIERTRTIIKNIPFYYAFLSPVCIGTFLFFALDIRNSSNEYLPSILLKIAICGGLIGIYLKYRTHASLKFWIGHIIYYIFSIILLLGGSSVLALPEISNIPANKWVIFFVYELVMIASLIGGVYLKLKNLGTYRDSLIRKIEVFSDVKTYTIKNESSKFEKNNPFISFMLAISVNILLLFSIYTGAMENSIFLIIPAITIGFSWANIQTFGPQIACLYLLRKYEKQTGRSFVNADYEAIQELRRTFFLSRWLMKDYKPCNPRKTT